MSSMKTMKSQQSILKKITNTMHNWSKTEKHYVQFKDIDIDHPALQKVNVYNNKKYKYNNAIAMESVLSKLLKDIDHVIHSPNRELLIKHQNNLCVLRNNIRIYLDTIIDMANTLIHRYDQLDTQFRQNGGSVNGEIMQNMQYIMLILNQKHKTNIISLQSWILKYHRLYELVANICNLLTTLVQTSYSIRGSI